MQSQYYMTTIIILATLLDGSFAFHSAAILDIPMLRDILHNTPAKGSVV